MKIKIVNTSAGEQYPNLCRRVKCAGFYMLCKSYFEKLYNSVNVWMCECDNAIVCITRLVAIAATMSYSEWKWDGEMKNL